MADPKIDQNFDAGPWRITSRQSHILRSDCERRLLEGCPRDSPQRCSVCKFNQDLDLPLPEMVFPESFLRLEHVSGAVLEFVALDALKLVNNSEEPLKIAAAAEWSKQRMEGLQEVKDKVRPFDWTYTTDYKGTLSSVGGATLEPCETSDRIDYEKLKEQERIAFYTEIILFEDELADNGAAMLSVKIRVMASGFFILQRFFLRVDGVLIRLNETRFHHQAGSDFILREYTRKEAKMEELRASSSILTDPNRLGEVLPVRELLVHKLSIPNTTTT